MAWSKKKFWQKYISIWNELEGWKLFCFYLLHYTLLFVLLQKFVFSDFAENNKSFIWNSDAVSSYVPRYIYISKMFCEGIQSFLSGNGWNIPLYNFSSWGAETDLQVEPIQCLSILCPVDKIDVLYDFLVITRFYLVGLSFSVMGFYFNQRPIPILVGAISYMFCGFSLYGGVIHPWFLAPMILLPLLVVGAEKILRDEKSFLFTFLVFISLINSLYFACMLAILIFIYFLTRYFFVYNDGKLSRFFYMIARFMMWGGTGIALSGFIIIPTLLQMLGTGRIGRDVGELWHYSTDVYEKMVTNFIVMPDSAASWNLLGFSILAIPTVILLFLGQNNSKEKNSLRCLFIILTVMYCSPLVAYIMSGFNTISARWCFAYALCVSAIIMFELPRLQTEKKDILATIGGCSFIYIIICYFIIEQKNYHEESLVFLLVSMFLIACCYIAESKGRKFILPICLCLTCISVYYTSFLMYDSTKRNLPSEFLNKHEVYSIYGNGQYASLAKCDIIKNDNDFFRVSTDSLGNLEPCVAFYMGLNGLSFHTSSIIDSYKTIEHDLEIQQYWSNNKKLGIDGRAPVLSLFNIKYFAKSGDSAIPYGFEKIAQYDNNVIFRNRFFLPVGYTYDAYMEKEIFDKLSSIEKQEVMLTNVVLEKAPNIVFEKNKIENLSQKVQIERLDMNGLAWQDGILKINEENATMTLMFKGIPNTDTYLRVVNLDLTLGTNERRWRLPAQTTNTSTTAFFIADGWLYSHGLKSQVMYLGNSSEGYTSCTLTFPQKGTFVLDDLEIWCQPMDNYAAQIEALRAEPLENIETNWRGLTGTVELSKDKIMCFGIPYETGWSVYVDGEKRELMQANIGLMAVELEAGYHYIELKYWMPGLTVGIIMSSIGVILLCGIVIYNRKNKMVKKAR